MPEKFNGIPRGFLLVPWVLLSHFGSDGAQCTAQHSDARNVVCVSYPHLVQFIGNYGVFWVYTAVSALGLLFCIMFVPETRHRTLEEIESHFR